VNLACRVQHHPSRAALLDSLLPRLAGLEPLVITDPGGRQKSSWRSHRLCLESVPEDATHAVCIQDDAWPCDDFAAHVQAAIAERPDRIIALFISGIGHFARRVNLARKQQARWLELPSMSYIPVVAVVYPARLAREIPAFADAKRIPVGRTDDAVIGQFARAHGLTACAPMPSLVQHLDSVVSVSGMPSGNESPHRLAAWFEENPAVAVG
jgi:hypothetical protein